MPFIKKTKRDRCCVVCGKRSLGRAFPMGQSLRGHGPWWQYLSGGLGTLGYGFGQPPQRLKIPLGLHLRKSKPIWFWPCPFKRHRMPLTSEVF